MNLTLNGESTEFSGQTLAELIAHANPPQPFAVALNTRFIPKSAYGDTVLSPNDAVEIVRPVVGG